MTDGFGDGWSYAIMFAIVLVVSNYASCTYEKERNRKIKEHVPIVIDDKAYQCFNPEDFRDQ